METADKKNALNIIRAKVGLLALAVILAPVFFGLLSVGARQYRSNLTILVIAKSETAAIQQNEITANLVALPATLNFVDRLLQDNPAVSDPVDGRPAVQRLAAWNGYISASKAQKGAGSLINISALGKTPGSAEALSQAAAHTLFSLVGGYYDMKNDLELRLIDGPLTTRSIAGWPWLGLLALLMGFGTAWVLTKIFASARLAISFGKQTLPKLEALSKNFVTPKIKPITSLEDLYLTQDQQDIAALSEATGLGQLENLEEQVTFEVPEWKYPNIPEMPARKVSPSEAGETAHKNSQHETSPRIRGASQASAPANLPIADDSFFAPTEEVIDIPLPTSENEAALASQTEPTQEQIQARLIQLKKPRKAAEPTQAQIKERLNQLLKGEL